MPKYTKATALAKGTVYSPPFDALYIGSGNYTETTTAGSVATPSIWYSSNDQGIGTYSGMSSSRWDDRGATGDHGATTGTSYQASGGPNGYSYYNFDTNTDYITVNDSTTFNIGTGEFEMMAVVKFVDNGNVYQHIAARDKSANNWAWYRASDAAGSNPGKIVFSIAGTDPVSATTPAYDTWYIVGVARDSGNNVQIYLNGSTDGSSVSNSADLDSDDDDNLIIGGRYTGTAYNQSLLGHMTEFILWESELSDANRASIVQILQDKYINAPQANIINLDRDGTAGTFKQLSVGKLYEIESTGIQTGSTVDHSAEDVIGLRE